jgi:hypothetical protein
MVLKIKIEDAKNNLLYVVRIRPVAMLWRFDRFSMIVEKRDLETHKVVGVWHLHITHKDGKIKHRHRKYP